MAGILEGIKLVDMGHVVAVTAAGAIGNTFAFQAYLVGCFSKIDNLKLV